MIPTKPRRLKAVRLPKVLERRYKQTKCRDCKVVLTRMDFAKILGKFTKVKIQFESDSPKKKPTTESSPNARLKNNENGMVQVHRSSYNLHPARKLLAATTGKRTRKFETPSPQRQTTKSNESSSPRQSNKRNDTLKPHQISKNKERSPRATSKRIEMSMSQKVAKKNDASSPQQKVTNVLKENNRLKKPLQNDLDYYSKTPINTIKRYGVVFVNPSSKMSDVKSKVNLDNLLPNINNSILPSKDWIIEYFPTTGEPKEDKIYDRIAAELEDLMYNEKTKNSTDNKDGKNDEFPSILDILNENPKEVTDKQNGQTSSVHLESSDVEAMLLGKSKSSESLPMEIDNVGISVNPTNTDKVLDKSVADDNPESPSILGEPEPKEVPVLSVAEKPLNHTSKSDLISTPSKSIDENDNTNAKDKNNTKSEVTQVTFKKNSLLSDCKTVICPKNLKYNIMIQGKSIELLGAPKIISSLEDLQVLLQIVDESELTSLYVLH